MRRRAPRDWQRSLIQQLAWFIGLRWIAGTVVILGALLDQHYLNWYSEDAAIGGVGAAIIGYNAVLWLLVRGIRNAPQPGRRTLLGIAALQIVLDLGCLTLLTLLTGGVDSPLRGFYVLHMVFASLMLPRLMAYAGATFAMAFMAAGLWASGGWPIEQHDRATMIAWSVMLWMTVWLANRITLDLRRQRWRLIRQNRRIKAMSRTLHRQQQGMLQQEKMAAVGQMAAGVAHEIANPLASMDGLLQIAERRPEKLRIEMVATLREQVSRINQIVRRMTAFAHPGEGIWQVTDLNSVVEKALEVIRFDPRLKGVQVQRELDPQIPSMRLQAESIQQVLINLIINALDAMEGVDKPTLTIRTEHSHACASFVVIDNGHGIPPDNRKRLFEPFFTTKPVGKGTGLGLSISYSLVREHGGEIMVASREGQGATFTVRLPLHLDPPSPHPAPVLSSKSGQ